MLKINIYYGGRGIIEDPTIYVMKKLTEVFEELNVQVKRYNLYEDKRGISVLPKTLKEADAVILAASVEWLGIGGLLQQFLDACWLYGDKEVLKRLYMMPVVISTTYGEKEADVMLTKAWEILGGIPCDGISAYVSNSVDFETNPQYSLLIDKHAESFYRSFTKKTNVFPSSSNAVSETVARSKQMKLTPQESEQLSMYVSDDEYVKKQKEDIEELTQMFKGMIEHSDSDSVSDNVSEGVKSDNRADDVRTDNEDMLIRMFERHFHPLSDVAVSFQLTIPERGKNLILETDNMSLKCYFGKKEDAHVSIKISQSVLDRIIKGRTTMQGAFMSGDATAKGDFKILRSFDTMFQFKL